MPDTLFPRGSAPPSSRPESGGGTAAKDLPFARSGGLKKDHHLLREAIWEAGALSLTYFGQSPRKWRKEDQQWVSEADLAVDEFLRQRLLDERPQYAWMSEESPPQGNLAQAGRVWIIDPIDGTRAFLEGQAEYTVSAALVAEGRPLCAAVFNPPTGEFFEAQAGVGAWMNGRTVLVSERETLAGSRLLVSKREFNQLAKANEVKGCEVRSLSSIAYKMCLVAAGQADLTLSIFQKNDWDLAAAHLIVEEAGGRVSLADGRSLVYGDPEHPHPSILAANPALSTLVSRQYANA